MEEQQCLTYVGLLHKTMLLFIWCDRALVCPQQYKLSWERALLVLLSIMRVSEHYFCVNEQYVVKSELSTNFTHI